MRHRYVPQWSQALGYFRLINISAPISTSWTSIHWMIVATNIFLEHVFHCFIIIYYRS